MSNAPQPEEQPARPAPVVAQVVNPAPQRRRSGWRRAFLVLLVLAFLGSLTMNFALGLSAIANGDAHVQEKYVSHSYFGPDKIAVLPIEGVIMESEDGFVKHAIDRAMEDKNVKAIVLRVDSPGGSVSGSDYIYHHLQKLTAKRNIPIVVSMGSIAASGGYYVSMAVGHEKKAIFAEPTAFTGSIGVIMPHYNIAGWMKDHKLVDDSIATHPLKQMGSMTHEMTSEERDRFKKLIDGSFERFKSIVRDGREKFASDPKSLDELATGEIFTAEQAKDHGLIDEVGFLEDAVDRAIELARLDKDHVKVVRYTPEVSLLSSLTGAQSHISMETEMRAMMDSLTPKAYYLVSWLPPLSAASAK